MVPTVFYEVDVLVARLAALLFLADIIIGLMMVLAGYVLQMDGLYIKAFVFVETSTEFKANVTTTKMSGTANVSCHCSDKTISYDGSTWN